jgi:hypothetical protein
MLENNVYYIPQKVIRIHNIAHYQEHNFPVKLYKPSCNEEILHFASKCLEIKKMQNTLLEESCIHI